MPTCWNRYPIAFYWEAINTFNLKKNRKRNKSAYLLTSWLDYYYGEMSNGCNTPKIHEVTPFPSCQMIALEERKKKMTNAPTTLTKAELKKKSNHIIWNTSNPSSSMTSTRKWGHGKKSWNVPGKCNTLSMPLKSLKRRYAKRCTSSPRHLKAKVPHTLRAKPKRKNINRISRRWDARIEGASLWKRSGKYFDWWLFVHHLLVCIKANPFSTVEH